MRTAPLWTVVDCRPSNVDKKSVEGQPAVRLVNYTDVYNNRYIDSSMALMEATAPKDQVERFRVLPGDIIITKDSETNEDIGVACRVRSAEPDMVCGYHLTLLRPDEALVVPSYLDWWLQSQVVKDYWRNNSFGVTRYSLVSTAVWRLTVQLPSLAEQRRIANYLDRETAEIDAMDAELDRLIATLRERKRAVSSALLRPHFDGELQPIWSLLAPVKDQNHPGEQVLSVYRELGVIPKASRDDNHNRTPADLSSYQLVRVGDLVINKMKAWQGSLGVSDHRGIVSPDYQVARPLQETAAGYLNAVLRCPIMVPLYSVNSKGIRPSQWRLYWEDFASLRVPLPPICEQLKVVAELDRQTAEINDLIADAQRLKSLLAERRSTLITDVVTGKKEVLA